jgi:hypothetical protein
VTTTLIFCWVCCGQTSKVLIFKGNSEIDPKPLAFPISNVALAETSTGCDSPGMPSPPCRWEHWPEWSQGGGLRWVDAWDTADTGYEWDIPEKKKRWRVSEWCPPTWPF